MKIQLLSYVTFGSQQDQDALLAEVRTQVNNWERKTNLKGQILTGKSKGAFKVFVLFSLNGGDFPAAIWDGLLRETLDENITLEEK